MDIKQTTHLQGITDLTVMAPVRRGLVPGTFNTCTHVRRVLTVLRVLNSVRQASREAALQRSPFADSIGRFRAIHFFRFAVVPTGEPPAVTQQLLLNVTFDGGWEPYMRLVWGPLGKLLDLIFCSCVGYPMASKCSFDEYLRWVREHEVPSTFFYADSPATVADLHYLRALEELHRNDRDGRGRAAAVGVALTDPPPTTVATDYAVATSIRVLKALSVLREFFPSDLPGQPPYGQDQILLRFARDLLADLRNWVEAGLFDPGGRYDSLNATFKHERAWLMSEVREDERRARRLDFGRADVQRGIVAPFPDKVRHGVLVLAKIDQPQKARENWLAKGAATPDEKPDQYIYRSVAFTHSGLRRLGVPERRLARLPHEFRVGMERRAGLLGDVRGNHPDNWKRPLPNWPKSGRGIPIELSTVHVVIQLRAELSEQEAERAKDGVTLAERFENEIHTLEADAGLKVLHVQPMHLNPRRDGEAAGRDHFGFADGISQPHIPAVPSAPGLFWSDQVKTGDVFLGYPNSRGDKPHHLGPEDSPGDALLDNGTFLVVRKLQQFPDRFDGVVADAARRLKPEAGDQEHRMLCEDIKSRMMGRCVNGDPMIKRAGPGKNDFIYRDDAEGLQCPHRSHVRRANPRTPLPGAPAPRIVRRGMSYVTPAENPEETGSRGLVFMAYNASIAEQFEVIQRWLTGGNSSGLCSTDDDALLGVPEIGQRRTYRYVRDGQVVEVDLGDQPLTRLEWGLYAFVPSMAALRLLAQGRIDEIDLEVRPREEPPAGLERWRALLEEDERVRAVTWANARAREEAGGSQTAKGYGVLVATSEKVLSVLQDDGRRFSVCGYGQRLADSGIGLGFLGLDDAGPHAGHAEQAAAVNKAIEGITEAQAFDAAFEAARDVIADALNGYAASTGVPKGPLDVIEYGRSVLSKLCHRWFGLPDEVLMHHGRRADDLGDRKRTLCPGHLLTVSRYVFGPHPTPAVEIPAQVHGARVLEAVKAMLERAGPAQEGLTDLVKAIVNADGIKGPGDLPARTVAGVMLGFPPTVLGNLVTVLVQWIGSPRLWELQLDWPVNGNFGAAVKLLREPFLQTMKQAPVPYAVWRTAMPEEPGRDKVIVGLGSAVAERPFEDQHLLMFGGSRDPASRLHTPHACPGYEMAMGVMLGSVAALLQAGELARTADPRILTLTAPVKPPVAPANETVPPPKPSADATPYALN